MTKSDHSCQVQGTPESIESHDQLITMTTCTHPGPLRTLGGAMVWKCHKRLRDSHQKMTRLQFQGLIAIDYLKTPSQRVKIKGCIRYKRFLTVIFSEAKDSPKKTFQLFKKTTNIFFLKCHEEHEPFFLTNNLSLKRNIPRFVKKSQTLSKNHLWSLLLFVLMSLLHSSCDEHHYTVTLLRDETEREVWLHTPIHKPTCLILCRSLVSCQNSF